MRWATPGIEVLCTGKPRAAAAAMIQSVSTPPPSPPSAAISRVMGRVVVGCSCEIMRGPLHGAAEDADDAPAQRRHHAVPPGRIADQLGAVERRAQHGGMGDLAAQPAADAAVDHRGDGVAAQRVGIGLDGQRRAAGQADAGMVAGADILVDAVARAHHARAARELRRIFGAQAALAHQLAFAVGDDHLEAVLGAAQRVLAAP